VRFGRGGYMGRIASLADERERDKRAVARLFGSSRMSDTK